MMNARMSEDGEGVRAARARIRRQWRTAALSLVGALGVSLLLIHGKTGPGHVRPGVAIAAVIAMAIVLPLAVYFNDRGKDELCRLNALRASRVGFYACLFGGWSWVVLFNGGIAPQPDVLILLLATSAVTLARYAMFKARG